MSGAAILDLLAPLLALTAGLAGGWAFFASLRRGVERWLAGGAGATLLLLQALRLLLMAALLAVAALAGAVPLLAATLGVLLARQLVLRRETA